MTNQSWRSVWSVVFILCASSNLFAAGGTSTIATKGQPAAVPEGWSEGVGAIVNDPTRTSGWNSWFSEWPNDVNQYAFEIASTDDLNRLLEKLAATKSEVRQVRLSYLKEPSGMGWVTNVPKDNNIAAIFSLGNQARIDEWYKRVRKPFGAMEFTAAPVAVPPTLTIFVQNKAVNLEELKIPEGIIVTSGYVPTVFHKFNTKDEDQRKAEAARKPTPTEKLDPPAQAAADKIEAFLKKQKPLSPEAIKTSLKSATGTESAPPPATELQRELLQRVKADQVARDTWVCLMKENGTNDDANREVGRQEKQTGLENVTARVKAIDADNTKWLKGVVEKHGWPSITLAGRDGADAAWLLVQHADADPKFQRQCLDLMIKLPKNEVSQEKLAYLTDRVLLAEGKKQRYGTQFITVEGRWKVRPLEDEANVDQRRAEVGLPPLAEYAKQIEELFGGHSKK